MNAQTGAPVQTAPSWLSLIAEVAGARASRVARIELIGRGYGPHTVIVQIVAHDGRVLGAERWEGSAEDLDQGALVDVGVWMTPDDARDARVIAFVDETDRRADPALCRDPTGGRGRRLSRDGTTRVAVALNAQGRAA